MNEKLHVYQPTTKKDHVGLLSYSKTPKRHTLTQPKLSWGQVRVQLQ